MNKRFLFVFAGQSNMMGACVYPPSYLPKTNDSYEYLYRDVHYGAKHGRFRKAGFPCGEFLYRYPRVAYPYGYNPEAMSNLNNYSVNTYFVPSMCNLKDESKRLTEPFSVYSEKTFIPGPSLAPYLAEECEKRGFPCAYAHTAKGAVSILHYFNTNMLEQYNQSIEKKYGKTVSVEYKLSIDDMCHGASNCFENKARFFFEDSKEFFPNEDTSVHCLVWLQGENDTELTFVQYLTLLEQLWAKALDIGFTHFFCIRVGYFGDQKILNIMKAQEFFCQNTSNAYMLTRACSFMPYAGQDNSWFKSEPTEEYENCRDSFLGFKNQHVNEKGFRLIASRAAVNIERILISGKPPIVEDELVSGMLWETEF